MKKSWCLPNSALLSWENEIWYQENVQFHRYRTDLTQTDKKILSDEVWLRHISLCQVKLWLDLQQDVTDYSLETGFSKHPLKCLIEAMDKSEYPKNFAYRSPASSPAKPSIKFRDVSRTIYVLDVLRRSKVG